MVARDLDQSRQLTELLVPHLRILRIEHLLRGGGRGGAGGRGRREDQGLNPRCAMSWLWDIQQVSYLPLEKRDSGPQLR